VAEHILHVNSGNIVYVSAPLPAFLILVMLIRGLTLDGAGIGIDAFIGNWDWEVLSQGTLWSESVSQIFFSIGVCFGGSS
jgi:SNF family Na+-dependent transporter